MSTSKVMDVVDAVVALLNLKPPPTGAFSQTFTAVPAFQPQYDLTQLQTLRVSVVAADEEDIPLARFTCQNKVSVDVGVQKKVSGDAESRALMEFCEEIKTLLKCPAGVGPLVLPGPAYASWIGMTVRPLWHPNHILEKKVFTRILTFVYFLKIAR